MTRFNVVALCLLVVSGLPSGSRARAEEDARDILKKAAQAAKAAKQVSYQAGYTGTGWVLPFVAEVKGSAILGGRSKWDINRFRCEVKLRKPRSEDDSASEGDAEDKAESDDPWSSEVHSYIAGSDGDVYFLIDPEAKMAYQDMDPAVLGSESRNIQRVVLDEFSAEEPFKATLEAEKIELRGTESVAGEDCYRITVSTPDEAPAAVDWFISKKDFLPRRVVRSYKNRQDPEGPPGTTELTISRLVVNPELSQNPFKLVVPEGFKKTDDFAP